MATYQAQCENPIQWRLRDYFACRGVFCCNQADLRVLNSAIGSMHVGPTSTASAAPLAPIAGYEFQDRLPQYRVHAQELPDLIIQLTQDSPLRLTKDVTVLGTGGKLVVYVKGTHARHPSHAYLQYQYPVVVAYASMMTWEGKEDLHVSATMPINADSDGFAGRRP
ncbi:hypothetical protein PTTG_08320 [Puccinia triticina 1-1 BBBD Race 1]|uniref:Uncharacterized protein n=1 Tax=Puccinia triticina (isolate 1-1 / race 1 (BBBD)) TaxID=630390 RepID=A0A180GKF6_PUCT1|nr:hypothetical protein PTTG_08320 [Puccinia triticina 1-1 BBBD Race 1]